MADWNPRANDLFLKALDVVEPDRTAFLAGECGGNADLRRAVDTLLNAHAQAGGFLADPHPDALPTGTCGDRAVTHTAGDGDATVSRTPPVGTPGVLIAGRYKLLQEIGEGGMGTVWMADQTEPVKRRVAVKLIRAERGSSATILARFEAERQAIALMDHPHIAKLLDAGTTAEGAPFFVMELVKGVPLTDYCDAHRLSVPDRLALFQSICGAVQHAHQKGIIHRDLKPSNILVESHDGKPVPKVIDFGLAKATTGMRLTEHTLFTGFGAVMGTPTYMAPEQATFNAVDIDTRADVYALGVILYELLTGTTPLTRDTVRNALLDEMLRLVREQEAPTPSSRLSSSESKPSVAANRQMEPAKLGRFVRGELDWIVLKALSKDRDRRYETANGFAADVGRFLAHEPVTAGPPSVRYRLRKFVRRNRPQVVAAGLVLLALVAGGVGTMTGLVEARQQRDRAINAEAETAAQLVKTQEAEGVARTEAAKATAAAALADTRAQAEREMRARAERQTELAAETTRFMTEVLTLGRPAELGRVAGTPTATPTVKQALDVAAEKIGTRFRGQPEIEMMVRVTVGKTYRELGEYAAARPHLERCLELAEREYPGSPSVLHVCRRELAVACAKLNDYKPAERLFELVIAGAERESGPFAKQALSVRNDLAQMFNEAGDYDRAEPLFRRILADAPRSPEDVGAVVNSASNNLGLLYVSRKTFDLAEPLLLAALKWAREHPGQGPHPAAYANNLANAYYGQNKFDLAEPLLKEAYERYHVTHGDAHPTTLTMINNLAGLYLGQKKYHLAEPLMESAVAACRKSLGPTTLTTLALVANLGTLYGNQDKNDRAEPLLVEALTGLRKHAPANHPITLNAAHSLGELYRARKDYARAEPLLLEAATGREKKLTAAHPSTGTSVLRLIVVYEAQNRHGRAEPWLRKQAAVAKGVHGADSAEYAVELSSLGRNLMKQNKHADAEPLLVKGYEGLKAREKTVSPQGNTRIPEALDRLIELYTATEKPDEVKKYRELRAKYPPELAPPPKAAT